MTTIACVLRRSAEFDIDYVARLRDGVAQHMPGARFICLSDVPVPCERIPLETKWPGWWSKMELFRPDIEGDLLYFDLDTVIVGPLDDFANIRDLAMLSDFYWPDRVASGVMYLPAKDRAKVWPLWTKRPQHLMKWAAQFDGKKQIGDQKVLGRFLGNGVPRFQDLMPGQVISYKVHVRQPRSRREKGNGNVPGGARVVCFHGNPRPRDLQWLASAK